jgi:excisionase family DNA binding protein
MGTIVDEEYITVAEAAGLLRVSPSTIWRWIDQGVLPAYRIGQRRIRLKRVDLARVFTPARQGSQRVERVVEEKLPDLGPLTKEEQERMLAAVEAAKRIQAEQLKRRSGKRFSSSADIINELRDQRTRDLE